MKLIILFRSRSAAPIKNLWPESYRTVWNAHAKDRLEDRLHALVISRKLDLKAAQREIATDWIAAYKNAKTHVLPPTIERKPRPCDA
jgi:hypothetical protein